MERSVKSISCQSMKYFVKKERPSHGGWIFPFFHAHSLLRVTAFTHDQDRKINDGDAAGDGDDAGDGGDAGAAEPGGDAADGDTRAAAEAARYARSAVPERNNTACSSHHSTDAHRCRSAPRPAPLSHLPTS